MWIGYLFMGLSLGIYILIGIITRTSNADQYYVAGRNVPAIYNGMATGSDWMSAASFISMAGTLSIQGFSGLAYIMGWTGGYLLLAVLLGPYLRQFGAYTIPDFLGARYEGNAARIIGVVAAITCSFTYLIAQVTGVGLIVSRFIGLDFKIGCFVGLIGVLFCSVLGRHEVGHVDAGRPVHHPDPQLPRPGRLPLLQALHRPDPAAHVRQAPAVEQRQGDRHRERPAGDRRPARSGRPSPTRSR